MAQQQQRHPPGSSEGGRFAAGDRLDDPLGTYQLAVRATLQEVSPESLRPLTVVDQMDQMRLLDICSRMEPRPARKWPHSIGYSVAAADEHEINQMWAAEQGRRALAHAEGRCQMCEKSTHRALEMPYCQSDCHMIGNLDATLWMRWAAGLG